MKKRGRYTRTEIVKLLIRWKRSGLTKQEFCRTEKIAHSTFANWFKKYRQEVYQSIEEDPLPAFIPLKIESPTRSLKPGYSLVEIIFPNGVQLRCTSDVDFDDLKRLIR